MSVYEVPLSPQPQTLSVALGAQAYILTVRWRNQLDPGWFLDIADDTGAPLVSGIPMVAGADLLAPYGYLGIPGSLVVQTDHDATADPTYQNLGLASHLYYVPPS